MQFVPISLHWTRRFNAPPTSSYHDVISMLAAMLMLLCTPHSLLALQMPAYDGNAPDWIRGRGENLQLRLSGEVKRSDGASTENAQVDIRIKRNNRILEILKPKVDQGVFQAWIPVNKSQWYSIVVTATCRDGARCTKDILRQQLRELVAGGLELQVQRPSRQVVVRLEHEGKEIANATVRAELTHGTTLRANSDANGIAKLEMLEGEKLARLTAWSDQSLIGGHQFSRKPIRDPQADSHVISMYKCRPYEVHARDQHDEPIVGIELALFAATPPPDVNYVGAPDEVKLVTNQQGVATYPWYPDIENAYCYVEILDEGWALESSERDQERISIVGKIATERQKMRGNVNGGSEFAGGFSIKLGTFQDEQGGRIDFVYSYSDPDGSFMADVLPDATYAVFLEDEKWVSKAVDLIPYQSNSKQRKSPVLLLSEGVPVRIRLTQGSEQSPMPRTRVNINSDHRFSWMEAGRQRSGVLGRNANAFTNDEGVIDVFAPEGELEVSVYLTDWRASREAEIRRGKVNDVHIHRKVDEAVEVAGRISPWRKDDQQITEAALHIKAIDGESREEFRIKTDEHGRFQFKTTATKLGAIAYSPDKRFAGTVVIKELADTAHVQLYPTRSYSGQITDQDGNPVADHKVWASIEIEDERRFGTACPTTFCVARIEHQTDSEGRYRFEGLPCRTKILLGTDTLDQEPNRFRSIDEIYYLPDDEPRKRVTKIGEPENRGGAKTLAQRFKSMQRDCRLGNYHLMVLVRDESDKSNVEFITKHMLNYATQKSVANYMQLQIDVVELVAKENRDFVDRLDWSRASKGVFACAYNVEGRELGRIRLIPEDPASSNAAYEFIERHLPTQQDAEAKWTKAFQQAENQDKLVWIRTGQRYCGPCFKLSRWIDDHCEVLEKDFVLVKVDDVRDLNGREIAERLTRGRSVGIPFHAIFDPNEKMITDSYGPLGNIGFMSGLEGKRHFRKMMEAACSNISSAEIEALLKSLEE